jgi:hypothetical protein
MTLRRDVRKAIQRGSSVYATVEEYKLGWATVRLATNGARLTNLSTQGAIVDSGDQVIVDYSAGVRPVVRPLFIPEYEEDELEPDEGKEVVPVNDDWACMVTVEYDNGYGLDPDGNDPRPYDCWHQFVPMATWTKVRFADNWWYAAWGPGGIYGDTVELWDTGEGAAGMYNETNNFGQDHIVITRTGRYWIHSRVEFDDVDGNRTTGWAGVQSGTWYVMDTATHPVTGEPRTPYNHDGHFKQRITKNGIPVAILNWRSSECSSQTQGGLDGPYTTMNAIVWCQVGDVIALEIWENNNGPYMNPGWGYPMSGTSFGNILSVAMIPGTERAIYESTSSQSAYMFADKQNQTAYTIGVYEGGDDYKQSAYARGSKNAGGQDQQGEAVYGSYIRAYTEGLDTSSSSSSAQTAYLSGN